MSYINLIQIEPNFYLQKNEVVSFEINVQAANKYEIVIYLKSGHIIKRGAYDIEKVREFKRKFGFEE